MTLRIKLLIIGLFLASIVYSQALFLDGNEMVEVSYSILTRTQFIEMENKFFDPTVSRNIVLLTARQSEIVNQVLYIANAKGKFSVIFMKYSHGTFAVLIDELGRYVAIYGKT